MGRSRSNRERTRVPARRGGTETDDSAAVTTTEFDPELYAFRFPNNFVNELFTLGVSVGFWSASKDIETEGRCGGMAFTSLDSFHARRPVPPLTPRDFPNSDVPPDGHPLADYIYARQKDSVFRGRGMLDGAKFLRWSGKSTTTLVRKTQTQEIPKIRRSIDAGEPLVLGLIGETEHHQQTNNHQVVCYGYEVPTPGDVELHIYDPNEPFQTPPKTRDHRAGRTRGGGATRGGGSYRVILSQRVPGSAFPYRSDRPSHGATAVDKWRGFFVQRYRPKNLGPRIIGSDTGSDKSGGPGTDRPPVRRK